MMKLCFLLFCIVSITGVFYSADQKVSLTQQYLELAYIIDYVRPFSNLPSEIKNKIARYCLSSPALQRDRMSGVVGYCFTHLISGNYLIGRSQYGKLIVFDIDKKECKGPSSIDSFYGDFKDADIKWCQRMPSPMKEGTVLVKHGRTHIFKINVITDYSARGVLCSSDWFPAGGDLICHPKLPYLGYIKKTEDASKVPYKNVNIQKYAIQYTIAIHKNEVFERNDMGCDEKPFSEKAIQVDNDISDYPLVWHPTELKFLYKNKTCLKEYDALSGAPLRSFKLEEIAGIQNISELSFDPYHVVYAEGGNYCVVLYNNTLYALYAGNTQSLMLPVMPNTRVHRILGINPSGHLLLLEMSTLDDRYVGAYDIHDNTVISLVKIPVGTWRVIFDPVTATLAVIEENDNKDDTYVEDGVPLLVRDTVQCIRIKVDKCSYPTDSFSLRHLMVCYAKMATETDLDKMTFNMTQFSKVVKETDKLKQW